MTRTPYRITGGLLLLTTVYAVLRYHIFKGVEWSHFPLYTLNKSISWTAVMLLCGALLARPFTGQHVVSESTRHIRKSLAFNGFALTVLHLIISIILLKPAYYPQFFEAGNYPPFSASSEWMLLSGLLGFFLLALVALTSLPSIQDRLTTAQWKQWQRLSLWGLLLTLIHVTIMGLSGWIGIAHWPGKLPPISLISAFTISGMFFLRFWWNRKNCPEK
ncbi:MAG: hypothetical protein D6675_07610 [Gemmatimonadetes bacterium]|nr:MAG: hypothetical protein D6675_07610 [Gemmatimonadota bacterium]